MALGDGVLKAAGATAALLPGIAAVLGGISTPPGTTKLFGGLATMLGALTVLVIWGVRGRIHRASFARSARTTTIAVLAGFAAIIGYDACYRWCVYDEGGPVVYFPLVVSGKVAGMVVLAGSRAEAIHRYGAWAVIDAINDSGVTLALSSGFLAVLYGTISVALSTALLVPAVRLESARKVSSG